MRKQGRYGKRGKQSLDLENFDLNDLSSYFEEVSLLCGDEKDKKNPRKRNNDKISFIMKGLDNKDNSPLCENPK